MKSKSIDDKLVFARCVAVICAAFSIWSVYAFSKMADEAKRLQLETTRLKLIVLQQSRPVTQNGIPVTTGNDEEDRRMWSNIPPRGSVFEWVDTNGQVWKLQR